MTMPEALAIVAGPSGFVTLSNVIAAPNAAGTVVVFSVTTDQSVQLNFRIWDVMNPSVSAAGTEAAAGIGTRTFSYTLSPVSANPQGKVMGFEITSVTAPPPTLRPYQGTVRIPAARTVANQKAVPVRWNMFGDGTRPVDGGGTGPLKNGPAAGNWSSYTWTQYNPKQTTFPTP